MQKITDHIDACSTNYESMRETFREVRDSIKNTNKLLLTFITGVLAVVITFTGYTYVQSQVLAQQLAAARAQQAAALAQIPDKTAKAVSVIQGAQNSGN